MNRELEKVPRKYHGDRECSSDVPSSDAEACTGTFDCPPEIYSHKAALEIRNRPLARLKRTRMLILIDDDDTPICQNHLYFNKVVDAQPM